MILRCLPAVCLRRKRERLPSPIPEKTIVSMRYGLFGEEEKTQKEVADKLGISQSYISRLEKRIISKLKKEMVRML